MLQWPSIAKHWNNRNRNSGWPTDAVLLNIFRLGVLLVPIGSKFGAKTDCSLEWRVSFSLSEKELIKSFNHTQFTCYALFKYLKKTIGHFVKHRSLCSYFIKTAMFWLCEEMPRSFWNSDNFVMCTLEVRKRLLYWIKYRFCPHYFIPENNLFEGLLDEDLKNMDNFLEKLMLGVLLFSFSKPITVLDVPNFDGLYMYLSSKNKFNETSKEILTQTVILRNVVRSNTFLQNTAVIHKSLKRVSCKMADMSYFKREYIY